MVEYLIGSPAVPALVVVDETVMVQVVRDTIKKGRRVVVARADRPGVMGCWLVMDGLVCEFSVDGRERSLLRWPVWAHRVRKLLAESRQDKETSNE